MVFPVRPFLVLFKKDVKSRSTSHEFAALHFSYCSAFNCQNGPKVIGDTVSRMRYNVRVYLTNVGNN